LDPTTFFQDYLAGPFLIVLYLMWKVYSWFARPADRPLYVKIKDIDIYTGMRDNQQSISGANVPEEQRRASITEMQEANKPKGPMGRVKAVIGHLF
jgi:amino acid transporter